MNVFLSVWIKKLRRSTATLRLFDVFKQEKSKLFSILI